MALHVLQLSDIHFASTQRTKRTKRATVAGYVVAGAVPLSPDGIQDAAILDESGFILAAVIDRALRKAPPQWLRPAAMAPVFWERLLNGLDDDFVAAVWCVSSEYSTAQPLLKREMRT